MPDALSTTGPAWTPLNLTPPGQPPTKQTPPPGFLPNGDPDPNYRFTPDPNHPLVYQPPGQPPRIQPGGTSSGPASTPPSSPGSTPQGPAPYGGPYPWQKSDRAWDRSQGFTGPPAGFQYTPDGRLVSQNQPPTYPRAAAPDLGRYQNLNQIYQAAGQQYGIDPGILRAIAQVESHQNPNIGPSSADARGIMQFIPSTAEKYGVNVGDPVSSIFGAAHYLRDIMNRNGGNLTAALQEYNGATNDPTNAYATRVSQAYAQGGGTPQRYIPASESPGLQGRPPQQWGRIPEGGYGAGPGEMPTGNDMPFLMQSILPLLGLLSGHSRIPAWMMVQAAGAFLQARNKRQILDQKIQQTKWQTALKESNARMTLENQAVGSAMAAYANDPQGMENAIAGLATQFDDPVLRDAWNNGGPAGVQALMQKRDAMGTDLNKTQLAQEKALFDEQMAVARMNIELANFQLAQHRSAQSDAEARQKISENNAKLAQARQQRQAMIDAGVPASEIPEVPADTPLPDAPPTPAVPTVPTPTVPAPAGPGPATPAAGTTPAAPQTQTPAAPPETEQPSSPASPAPTTPAEPTTTPATTAPVTPPATPSSDPSTPPTPAPGQPQPLPGSTKPPAPAVPQSPAQPAAAAAGPRSDIQVAASQLLNGGDPDQIAKLLPKDALPYAGHIALQKWGEIQKLAEGDNRGPALLEQIHAIDPEMADYVKRIAANQTAIVNPSGFASRLANYSVTLQNLAQKVNPGWRLQQYASKQEFRTSFNPDKPVGRTLQRTTRLLSTAQALADDANSLPNTNVASANQLIAWFEGQQIGDPRYTKFITDWRNFATEAQGAVNMGVATVTLTSHMIDTLRMGATPQMIRQGLAEDLKTAVSAIDPVISGWHHAFPGEDNPDMYNQGVYAQLFAMSNMNINTGAMPPPLPDVGYKEDWGGKTHYYLGGDFHDPMNWSTTAPPVTGQ